MIMCRRTNLRGIINDEAQNATLRPFDHRNSLCKITAATVSFAF